MLTASQILAAKTGGALFPDPLSAERVYRELIKQWHPDHNHDPIAEKVSAHINGLYAKIKKGTTGGDFLVIKSKIGEKKFAYFAKQSFSLGELYICDNHLIWATDRRYDDLAKRSLEVTKAFEFPNEKEKGNWTPRIPRNSHTIANGDRAYTIMDRPCDLIRVADILSVKGKMDPKHMAWVLSRIYNLCGWLDYSNITHLDIGPQSVFIDPVNHRAALLGGWFFSGFKGSPPLAAPTWSARFKGMPANRAHLSMVRLLGQKLLGHRLAYLLRQDKSIPLPLREWLLGEAGDNPSREEARWREVLQKSFGPPKFLDCNITTADIYT